MIGNLIGCIVVLVALFGFLCNLTGEKNKGNQILNNCMTSIVIYLMIVTIFGFSDSDMNFINLKVPFLAGIQKYETIKTYISNDIAMFALDFAQLVTLVFLINIITNSIKFENAGFAGMISSRLVIVMISVFVYGFLMNLIENNIIFKWSIYCIECLITGVSIIYTPLSIVSLLTGIKKDNYVNTYILAGLKESYLGKCITKAITSSIVLVIFLCLLDYQYGGVFNVVDITLSSFSEIAACIIVLMGIYFMVKSLFGNNKNK